MRRLPLVEPRPEKRRDCEPCPTCQAWRDDDANPFDDRLACGHDWQQAVEHSRPCLFVGCHHHLYLDVHPQSGALKLNFPELEPEQMADSCVLDVVADGCEATLDVVGAKLGLTRERARQIEDYCMQALRGVVRGNLFGQLVRDKPLPEIEEAMPRQAITLHLQPEVEMPRQSRGEVRARIRAARAAADAAMGLAPHPRVVVALSLRPLVASRRANLVVLAQVLRAA